VEIRIKLRPSCTNPQDAVDFLTAVMAGRNLVDNITLTPANHILDGVLGAMRDSLNMIDAHLECWPPDALPKAHQQRAQLGSAIHVLEAYIKAQL
jgi:hypothetical protein